MKMISTLLTRARRSAAALALKPHPGWKGLTPTHSENAELDKHNSFTLHDQLFRATGGFRVAGLWPEMTPNPWK